MPEVGEVARIRDGDLVARLHHVRDELLWRRRAALSNGCCEWLSAVQCIETQPVENIRQALALRMQRSQPRISAIPAGYAIPKIADLCLKPRPVRRRIQIFVRCLVDRIRPELDITRHLLLRRWRVLRRNMADHAHAAVDALDRPSGKCIQSLPVAAQDQFAHRVDQRRRQQRAGRADCCCSTL